MSTTKLEANLWRIDLPNGALPIDYTLMRRDTYNDDPSKLLRPTHKVIVVDLPKFIQLVELAPASFVVPPAAEWGTQELEGRTEFTAPYLSNNPRGNGSILMPVVGHHFRIVSEPRPAWRFWEPERARKVYHATYTNGRHRTRLVEYGGALTMPVEVDPSSVNFYIETCGMRIER